MVETLKSVSSMGKKLIIRFPYYGIFLSTLNRIVDNNIPTLGVSRNKINTQLSINEEFWKNLIPEHKLGVLLHEILHICFFHITMRKSFPDHHLFNIAADLEINQYIFEMDDVNLPDGALTLDMFDLSKFQKKGTKFYYYKLKGLKDQNNKAGRTLNGLLDQMKSGEQVVCSHETWKEFEEVSDTVRELVDGQIKTQIKHSYEYSSQNQGNLPNSLRGYFEELLKPKKSLFNWRAAIRRFNGAYSTETYTKTSRRKINKRFPDLAGLKVKQRKNLLCAIDTSGSVSQEEFIEFMREIDVLKKSGVGVTIVECDAYVDKEKGVYKYKNLKQITGRSITGGGGTSFDPPIKYLNEKANKYCALIYFTDGYAYVPKVKPRKPIMWVLSQNGKSVESMKSEGFPGYIIQIPNEETFN